jgi:4-amino-4-deoxy-L-arabinose transferase-like glycosyltransferase
MQSNSTPTEKIVALKDVFLILDNHCKYYQESGRKKFSLFLILNFVLLVLFWLSSYTRLVNRKIDLVIILTGLVLSILWLIFMWMVYRLFLTIQKDMHSVEKKIKAETQDASLESIALSGSFQYSEYPILLQVLTSIIGILMWLIIGLINLMNRTEFDPGEIMPFLLFGIAIIMIIVIIAKKDIFPVTRSTD